MIMLGDVSLSTSGGLDGKEHLCWVLKILLDFHY
jgi:hypothetical protein